MADNLIPGPRYLYVAWAGYEGKPIKAEVTIVPTYCGGRSFRTPNEETLFTVVSEELAVN